MLSIPLDFEWPADAGLIPVWIEVAEFGDKQSLQTLRT